ncbi:unannotated protein [freshwater metagenome]|uniref:Unannotated protein n=1 Tax=freshwater metagenome TaxID=449393 RepID=A0A6J6G4D2_9ZZZZ
MLCILNANFNVRQRNGPLNVGCFVGKVKESVFSIRAPVVVDQIGVGGVRFEGLKRVSHTAGNKHSARGVDLEREGLAEPFTLAQVNPCTENAAGCDGDILIPGLSVNSSCGPGLFIERNVVLHGTEVGKPQFDQFRALPVFFKPPAVVAVNGKSDNHHSGDWCWRNGELLTVVHGCYWPCLR